MDQYVNYSKQVEGKMFEERLVIIDNWIVLQQAQ